MSVMHKCDACAGRDYECDTGFVGGADGICVPYMRARTCGDEGLPTCKGAEMNGMPP